MATFSVSEPPAKSESSISPLTNLKGEAELPKSSLGTLRAVAVSPDLRWLAVSGTSRGAVWDLSSSKRLYYTRGFRGAYFDGEQAFYADFPKEDPQERTIARADLSRTA